MNYPSTFHTVLLAMALLLAITSVQSSRCKRAARANVPCPMNVTMNMPQNRQLEQMFRGLFLPEQALDNIYGNVYKINSYRVVKNLSVRTCRGANCYKGQSTRAKRETTDCCDTSSSVIQLTTVEQNGNVFSVVHLPDGQQYLTENKCASEDSTCTSGTCRSILGLHWVLVYDPTLNYMPPVKFVMVEFKMGCTCEV